MRALLLCSLLSLAACEAEKPAAPVTPPPEPPRPAEPAPPTAAAAAALQRFLPSVASSPGMVDAVASALQANQKLGAVARGSSASLDTVEAAVKAAGLPEVDAAIPLAVSEMNPTAVSAVCGAGAWRFMPETAAKFGLNVKDCTITGAAAPFTPEATDEFILKDRPYFQNGACAITACATDERLDLALSTRAAIALLSASAADATISAHPQKDALVLMSYNAGRKRVVEWLPTRGADAFAGWGAVIQDGSGPIRSDSGQFVPQIVAAAAYSFCRNETNAADPICAGLPKP